MASENKSKVSILTNGIIKENPVLRLVLGTCSCLAVTTAVSSALGMGAAFTFVLVCSNILISLLRNVIPAKVHLPCFLQSSTKIFSLHHRQVVFIFPYFIYPRSFTYSLISSAVSSSPRRVVLIGRS